MKLLHLFVVFSLAFITYSQARTLTWLPDYTLTISGALPYNKVSLIDNRSDKGNIGFIKTGAFARFADLVTEDSLSKSLATYCNSIIKAADKKPGELLIVLHDFSIEDTKGAEGIGTVHLWADLFLGQKDSFQYLQTVDSLHEIIGVNVTYFVLRQASVAMLNLLEKSRPTGTSGVVYSRSQAVRKHFTDKERYPLYSNKSPTRGIYHSYQDFLQLRTRDTLFTAKTVKGGGDVQDITTFYRKQPDKGRTYIKPHEYFAINDGKRWYVAHESGFAELQKLGNEYCAVFPLKGISDKGVSATTLIGGLAFGVGGALVGQLVDPSISEEPDIPYKVRFVPTNGTFVKAQRIR
jgi:hypothetical protein